MSINELFTNNDTILYCREMHCNNIIPPIPGNPGDLYTVNLANQAEFSKTYEGSGGIYRFKNCEIRACNYDNLQPSVVASCTQSTGIQPAILALGEEDTSNSWFFIYSPVDKNIFLGQNAAAVNKDFSINCGTGNFIVNNKLKLPTVAANAFVKMDNTNVLVDTVINLNDLNDVVITAPISGQSLVYNGINFVNSSSVGNLISVETRSTPGAASIIVPPTARYAILNAVGGGGAGANPSGLEGGGGGGAAGGIVNYPLGVKAGQTINIVIGAGGSIPGSDGTATTINLGTFTITCTEGQGGQLAIPSGNGGNGGSVILPFATTVGGAGGIAGVGADGGVGVFAYSGAGGGAGTNGGPTFNGGAQLLFTAGTGNNRQGGGGASCFGDGGSYITTTGILGSGGPGDANGIFAGGNGFVTISFYS